MRVRANYGVLHIIGVMCLLLKLVNLRKITTILDVVDGFLLQWHIGIWLPLRFMALALKLVRFEEGCRYYDGR